MPFEDRLPCPVLWKMLRVTALLTATYGSQQALLLHFRSHSSDGKVWAKNVVLQKCCLASFKPGQPDWKTSFWVVVLFLGHFLQQGLPSFPAPLSWWKWFYWCFHSLKNVSYFPRTLQYKYFPPRYLAVCPGGWGRYIWVSLSGPRDTLQRTPPAVWQHSQGGCSACGGDCADGGSGFSFLPPLCGTSLLMLCYWVWVPGIWAAASLGFPASATSHIYDTDIKEAQEIDSGLLFPHIYPEERTYYSILKLMFMHHFTLSR